MTRIEKQARHLSIVLVIALTALSSPRAAESADRQSSFGVYAGYSAPDNDGYTKTSVYVSVRDGTRLAVDVYLPTKNGRVPDTGLPVVWSFTPYNRAIHKPNGVVEPSEAAQLSLVPYGYAVAIADVRGKGASFGVRNGPADTNEANDAYDVNEWLASQSWSNGSVGMMGCSYYGATALEAARSAPPHLKAVFVGTTMFDQYETFATGGIAAQGLYDDTVSASSVVEVDADQDRHLLRDALVAHERNTKTGEFFASSPYRDDLNPFTHSQWWIDASLYPYLHTIRPDLGMYVYGGYYDVYSDQTVLKYQNLTGPKKLAFGNWHHCETPGFRMDVERLRFFDYWLKHIPNGVMDEAPVHVYVTRAQDGTEWRALKTWPAVEKLTRYYLMSESSASAVQRGGESPFRAGKLQAALPSEGSPPTSLTNVPSPQPLVVYGMPRANVDPYSAVYTLPAQDSAREIFGSPVAHLWISSAGTDADVYVYLEAVNRMGGAEVISRGVLRASHRKLGKAPYDTQGLPWHEHLRADAQPLTPNTPVALDIAMSPTAYTLRKGDLLSLAVTTRPPDDEASKGVDIQILSHASHASYVEVPDTDTRSAAMNPDAVTARRTAFRKLVDDQQ